MAPERLNGWRPQRSVYLKSARLMCSVSRAAVLSALFCSLRLRRSRSTLRHRMRLTQGGAAVGGTGEGEAPKYGQKRSVQGLGFRAPGEGLLLHSLPQHAPRDQRDLEVLVPARHPTRRVIGAFKVVGVKTD